MLTIVGVPAVRLTLNGRVEQVLRDAAKRAVRYLRDGPAAAGAPEDLDVPLPDKPTPPEDVLARLDVAAPTTIGAGGPLPAALAAGWLSGAWDEPPATFARVALRWLAELLGLPAGTPGGLAADCADANRAGLAAARDRVLARAGWDVETRGLFGAPPVRVLVGGEPDPEFWKALVPLGFGREQVTRVRVDGQGRLRPTLIPPATGPTVVWAQAGNRYTGALDPLTAICARAQEMGAWVHVDGSVGLWAAASPALRDLVAGAGAADSWALDTHGWLGTPYHRGVVFVRDGAASAGGPGDVELWAALMSLGRLGAAEVVERACGYARRIARELAAAGWTVHNDVVLNQVLVSLADPAGTAAVVGRLAGLCEGTVWQGRPAMRISVGSAMTTDEDVTRTIAAILNAGSAPRQP